jgi:LPXTG-motif cell wall-anchored protein
LSATPQLEPGNLPIEPVMANMIATATINSPAATATPNVVGRHSEPTISSAQQRLLPATGRDIDATLLMAVALTTAGLLLIGLRRSQMISRPRDDG